MTEQGMECGCIIEEDFDPPELYDVRTHRARKIHTCCECREHILPGEEYEYVFGIWEGDKNVFKTCAVCVRIRRTYCCYGFIHTNLREALWGALGVNYVTGETQDD